MTQRSNHPLSIDRLCSHLLVAGIGLLWSCGSTPGGAASNRGEEQPLDGGGSEAGLPDAVALPGGDGGYSDDGSISGGGHYDGSTAPDSGSDAEADGCEPVKETCNNADDDCDGVVDSFKESCKTQCGTGERTCTDGKWGACSAAKPIQCTNYHSCKKENMCVSSCPSAPAEGCNLRDDDCDGACDEGADCRVAIAAGYKDSTGDFFYTSNPSEGTANGYSMTNLHAFYLYKYPASGLVPFYRCLLNSGYHFYTTSKSCEGAAATFEGGIGYIGLGTACGAVPLYRLTRNGSRFYTTSVAERNNAQNNLGFTFEGVAGYVWTSP